MMYKVTIKRTFVEYGETTVEAADEQEASDEAKDNADQASWSEQTIEEETIDSVEACGD